MMTKLPEMELPRFSPIASLQNAQVAAVVRPVIQPLKYNAFFDSILCVRGVFV
jgi:hypothetical protein